MIQPDRPDSWEPFFALCREAPVPTDFMTAADRDQGSDDREPFEGFETGAPAA